MPDKSKDICEENCRIFIPVENNLFVLLAKFITSEIKLPPGIQLLAASPLTSFSSLATRQRISFQVCLLSIFVIVFFQRIETVHSKIPRI